MENYNFENNKLITLFLCISPFIVLFSSNGSFSLQSLVVLIVLDFLIMISKSKKVYKINAIQKKLFIFIFILTIATLFNCLINSQYISSDLFIELFYFYAIFAWFYINTSNYTNDKTIKKTLTCYNIVSVIMSIQILIMSFGGAQGKIMIINFAGIIMDENYVTALVSLTPIYCFVSLLYDKNSLREKIFLLIELIICCLAVALAGSRAALLSMVVGLALTYIYYIKDSNSKKKMFNVFLILFFGLLLIVNIKSVMPTWIYNRYFNSNYLDNSNRTRLLIWKNALNGIKDQPILGFGVGFFDKIGKYPYTAGKSTPGHQTILDIFIYSGVVGTIVFCSFLFSIIIPFIKNKKYRKYIGVIICATLISMILSATKTVFLWNNLIYLCLIYNSNLNKKEENENGKSSKKQFT